MQIPPVGGGGDLYIKTTHATSTSHLDSAEGYKLFRTFTMLTLPTQHRASDPNHIAGVTAFRDWTREGLLAREKFLQSLKFLTPDNVRTDPAWVGALIVSTDRKCVHLVNEIMLHQYAKSVRKPTLRWRLPMNADFAARLSADVASIVIFPKK